MSIIGGSLTAGLNNLANCGGVIRVEVNTDQFLSVVVKIVVSYVYVCVDFKPLYSLEQSS